MKCKKIIYAVLFMILSVSQSEAQQVPLYSQYVLNSFLLNPAIAGAEGYTSVNLIAREQWIGIREAPNTYGVSAHSMIKSTSYIRRKLNLRLRQKYGYTSGKVGLGAYVYNDQSGALGKTGMRFSYAYHLYNKSNRTQLSLGLSLMAYQLRFNEDRVRLRDQDDDFWMTAREPVFIPDADFGIYFSSPTYYFGFSADQLLESVVKFGTQSYSQYKLDRNYYLLGGYDFNINRKWTLSPSTLLKYAENGVFQADISTKVSYDQSYWGGVTYRTGHAIIFLAGLSIDRYVFAYAFDISLAKIMKHSYGSHEFLFALKLGNYKTGYRWISR